jgi:O-antigen/teichoic acid export membrane protein
MCAKFISFGISFLLPLLTVRYLTQTEYGTYRQVFLVVMNCVAILPLGFSMSAYYYLSREPEKRVSVISNILLFNFVLGGLACGLLFIYPQLLGSLFQNTELTRLAPKIGVVIWFWIFSTFLETVALANHETKLATGFIIAAQFTKTLLMVGAVLIFGTVDAFVYAAIVQGFLQTCVLLAYLSSRFPGFWSKFEPSFFVEQTFYAIPFGLAGLLFIAQSDIHNYFVGHHFGEEQFAVYAVGCFQLPLIAMLYESFGSVLIPRMSELQSTGNKREMVLTTVGVMQKLALIYLPTFAFLMVVADVFITTLFTPRFAASVPIFRVNLLIIPVYCLIIDPLGRAFKELGGFLLKVRALLFIGLVAALWLGVRHLELHQVIGIVVAVIYLETAISMVKIVSMLEIGRKDVRLLGKFGKTAFGAGAAGIALYFFYKTGKDYLLNFTLRLSHDILSVVHLERAADFIGGTLFLGICFLLFAALYLLLVNKLGVFDHSQKERVFKFIRRLRRQPRPSIALEAD